MKSASELLNVAIVGLGRMGEIYARTITAEISETRIIAIVDPNEAARESFRTRFRVPNAFAGIEDALALDDLDAVIVASPTSTHQDIIVATAAAGKAIFTEKPLALSLVETRSCIEAVERAGVMMQVGFMRRFDEGYRRAKDQIAEGKIGIPVIFNAIGRDIQCPRVEFAAHSGGIIIDMGIHDMDIARWLMGSEITSVSAETTLMVCQDLHSIGDMDNAVINLRFESGALGSVELSRNAFYGYDLRTEVLGSNGVVRVGVEKLGSKTLANGDVRAAEGERYLMDRFGRAYGAQIHHFVECIRTGKPPAATGADALAAFEISLAATYSARTGRPVTIDSIRTGWTPSDHDAVRFG